MINLSRPHLTRIVLHEQVRNFLIHFWKEMPTHLMEMLEIGMIADVIASCDMIVYNALTDVLIPSTIQDMPQRWEVIHEM